MASTKSTKKDLVDQLVVVFRARGYEGATLTQLAKATGLGKASLYHHFPGGKAEMAAVLLRHGVSELQQKAFRHLTTKRAPMVRIRNFIAGFDDYAEQGNTHCLVAVLAQGSAAEAHGRHIAQQFQDWQATIAQTFEDSGMKRKKAKRLETKTVNFIVPAGTLRDAIAFCSQAKSVRSTSRRAVTHAADSRSSISS